MGTIKTIRRLSGARQGCQLSRAWGALKQVRGCYLWWQVRGCCLWWRAGGKGTMCRTAWERTAAGARMPQVPPQAPAPCLPPEPPIPCLPPEPALPVGLPLPRLHTRMQATCCWPWPVPAPPWPMPAPPPGQQNEPCPLPPAHSTPGRLMAHPGTAVPHPGIHHPVPTLPPERQCRNASMPTADTGMQACQQQMLCYHTKLPHLSSWEGMPAYRPHMQGGYRPCICPI